MHMGQIMGDTSYSVLHTTCMSEPASKKRIGKLISTFRFHGDCTIQLLQSLMASKCSSFYHNFYNPTIQQLEDR